MHRIFLLLPFLLIGCKNQPTVSASDVTLAMASVPTQVCIHINASRPEILRQAGEAILETATEEDWPMDRRLEALERLHERDDQLRAIVSPSFVRGSEVRTGSCRRLTEMLEDLSTHVESWEDMESMELRVVITDILHIMDEVVILLGSMGVPNLYAVLDSLYEISGVGLGEHLANFIELANKLIAGENPMEATDE
jgi:hypothetical protein